MGEHITPLVVTVGSSQNIELTLQGSTAHWGPNDEAACDQQDISHQFWSLMLKGELYRAPVKTPQVSISIREVASPN